MCSTGNGTTVTLAASGAVGRIIGMEGFDESIADIEDNDIGIGVNYSAASGVVDHMQFCPGRIIEHSELVMAVVFDPRDNGSGIPLTIPPLGKQELVTVNFPKADPVSGDAATLSGQAWIRLRGVGALANNERTEGQLRVRFKGGNATGGPSFVSSVAWTPEAP